MNRKSKTSGVSKGKKMKKKEKNKFNPEELERKGELLKEVFPTAAQNVAEMLTAKSFPVVYQEMKHKWQLFVHASRLKDLYIHKLKEDIDLIDEQKTILHQLQINEIDKVLADCHRRSTLMVNEYERRRKAIVEDRNCFLAYNVQCSRSEQDWLQSFSYLLQENNDEYNEFFFQDVRLVQYEKRQQYITEMNSYGEWVLQVMKQACARINKIYEDFVETTRDRRVLHDSLKEQTLKEEAAILDLNKKIAKLQVEQAAAADTAIKTKDIAQSISHLKAEKSTYVDAQKILRQRLVSEAEEDKSNLAELSQVSNHCIQQLEEDLKLAEDILKYALLCSKYETEVEKAQPFSSLISSIELPIDKKFSRFKLMHRLLYRMAMAELHCDFMETVKRKYEEENSVLIECLKEILSSFGSLTPQKLEYIDAFGNLGTSPRNVTK